MLRCVEAQLALVRDRLRTGEERLRRDSACLERLTAEKSATAAEADALHRRLEELIARAHTLSQEEAAVRERLAAEADDYAAAQLLSARLRRELRALRGYQQTLVCLLSPATEGDSVSVPRVVQVGTDSLRVGGKTLSYDLVISKSTGASTETDWSSMDNRERDMPAVREVASRMAREAVAGFNWTIVSLSSSAVTAAHSMVSVRGHSPPPRPPGAAVSAVAPSKAATVRASAASQPTPPSSPAGLSSSLARDEATAAHWTAPRSDAEGLPSLLDAIIEELFCSLGAADGESRADRTIGVTLDRYRVTCAAAAIVVPGGANSEEEELVDLMPAVEERHRRCGLELPHVAEDAAEAMNDDHLARNVALRGRIVRSIGEARSVVRHALQQVKAAAHDTAAPLPDGPSREPQPHSFIQLHVESFSTAGDYRQAVVRFLLLPARCTEERCGGACSAYLRDAIALCAAESTSALKQAATAESAAMSLRRRLRMLPSHARIGAPLAAILNPVFGGNTKAMLALGACSSGGSGNGKSSPDRRVAEEAEAAEVDALVYAHHFHEHVRHAAVPFVLPAEVLRCGAEVRAASPPEADEYECVALSANALARPV